MKIISKTLFIILTIFFFSLGLTGCPLLDYFFNKTPETEELPEEIPEPEEPPFIEENIFEEPEIQEEPEPVVEVLPIEEPEIQEPEEVVIIPLEEPDVDEDEYLRSIDNLDSSESVTKTEFNDDKNAILNAISELSKIMESQDFNKWLSYLEPDSIEYYSNPVNLRKAQKKLPNKTITIRNIEDYFKFVFIPSRQRSQVDEIRYISKSSIKAVQVKEDKSIVVYYYFTKVGNKWLVHLPMI